MTEASERIIPIEILPSPYTSSKRHSLLVTLEDGTTTETTGTTLHLRDSAKSPTNDPLKITEIGHETLQRELKKSDASRSVPILLPDGRFIKSSSPEIHTSKSEYSKTHHEEYNGNVDIEKLIESTFNNKVSPSDSASSVGVPVQIFSSDHVSHPKENHSIKSKEVRFSEKDSGIKSFDSIDRDMETIWKDLNTVNSSSRHTKDVTSWPKTSNPPPKCPVSISKPSISPYVPKRDTSLTKPGVVRPTTPVLKTKVISTDLPIKSPSQETKEIVITSSYEPTPSYAKPMTIKEGVVVEKEPSSNPFEDGEYLALKDKGTQTEKPKSYCCLM